MIGSRKIGEGQTPFPYIFHEQVQDNIRFPYLMKGRTMSDDNDSLGREARMEIHMNDTRSNSQNKENKMASKVTPTIVVVGEVVANKTISGKTMEGKAFKYNQLTIKTNNGGHWDSVKPRNGADKATIAVFATAKAGDVIAFSECFLQPFIYNDKPCVSILAGKASK